MFTINNQHISRYLIALLLLFTLSTLGSSSAGALPSESAPPSLPATSPSIPIPEETEAPDSLPVLPTATISPTTPPPAPTDAPTTPPPENNETVVVADAAGLLDAMLSVGPDGGEIFLSADIDWDKGGNYVLDGPVTIQQGEHTIHISGNALWDFSGPLTCIGSGVVLNVTQNGMLRLFESQTVFARGNNAVAIKLSDSSSFASDFPTVRAEGDGAVGILSESTLSLRSISIFADGNSSRAIQSHEPLSLTYCLVEATGEGSLAIQSSAEVELNLSYVEPAITEAVTPAWTMDTSNEFGYTSVLGNALNLPPRIQFHFICEDRRRFILAIPISWEAPEDIDKEGIYPVSGTPRIPLPKIPIAIPETITASCYVLDSSQPRFFSALYGRGLSLFFLSPRDKSANYLLSCSTDLGSTWSTLSDTPTEHTGSSVFLELSLSANTTYLFRYEEHMDDGTIIKSNTFEVTLSESGQLKSHPWNGDYDGGDQGGGGSPEPPFGWPDDDGAPEPSPSKQPISTEAPAPSGTNSLAYLKRIYSALVRFLSHLSSPATAPTPPSPLPSPSPSPIPSEAEILDASPPVSSPTQNFSPQVTDTLPVYPPVPSFDVPPALEPSPQYYPPSLVLPSSAPTPPLRETPSPSPSSSTPAVIASQKLSSPTPRVSSVLLLFLLTTFGVFYLAHLLKKQTDIKSRRATLLCFCITVILSGTLFFLLKLQHDNKYSSAFPQAQNGILQLSKTDIASQPLIFLWNGWAFYEGALLTPTDIATLERKPSRYLYLGEDSHIPQRATYQLRICAPVLSETYVLELPIIYGDYRLWINGTLISSSSTSTQKLTVPIPAGANTEIIVSVQAEDGLYRGMTHPPAFGPQYAVEHLLMLRAIWSSVIIAAAAILAILYFYVALKIRKWRPAIYFFLLCLSYIGNVVRTPLTYLGIPTDLSYSLGRVCYYAIFLFIMSILGEICRLSKRKRFSIFFIGALMCAWVLMVELLWTTKPTILGIFNFTICGYKIICAFILLSTSISAVLKVQISATPLLAGSIVFSLSLFIDRLYPNYEPALFQWPVESAAFIMLLLIAGNLVSNAVMVYANNITLSHQEQAAKDLAIVSTRQYMTLAEQMDEFAQSRHEMRSILLALQSALSTHQYSTANEIITKHLGNTWGSARYSQNLIVNAVLTLYLQDCCDANTTLSYDIGMLPRALPFSPIDLCMLLNNILSNALDACSIMPTGQRRAIDLKMYIKDDSLFIQCENTKANEIHLKNGIPITQKQEWGHGQGLKTILQVIHDYNGIYKIVHFADRFQIEVVLPMHLSPLPDSHQEQ